MFDVLFSQLFLSPRSSAYVLAIAMQEDGSTALSMAQDYNQAEVENLLEGAANGTWRCSIFCDKFA